MASLDMLERNDTSLENTVDMENAACYIPTVNSPIEYSLNVSADIALSSEPIDDTTRFRWSEGLMGRV